jgi:dTMP kinase
MPTILICFIGTDGSGKSTLAHNVFNSLMTKGLRAKKVYGRHQHMLSRLAILIGRKLYLTNTDMFGNYDDYLRDKRKVYKKSSLAIKLYIYLLVLEYFIQVLFRITIPLKFGYSIIADRYVYDTVINDIAVDKGLSYDDVSDILAKFWSFIPKPDAAFLVSVPEEVAISRKNDIPSISYLQIRNQLYNQLVATENLVVLDGTLPVDKLKDKVISLLNICDKLKKTEN